MRKVALVVLLLFAGCTSPLQREFETATLRSKIADIEASVQSRVLEACEARRQHSAQCYYQCQYGKEWHRNLIEERKRLAPKKKPTGKAPVSIYGP